MTPAQPPDGGKPATTLLRFEAVGFRYPCALEACINGLSLDVPEGWRCGLIGDNGCGKTTLFLLANGLLRPQQGQLRWREAPIRYARGSLRRLRQQVGLVFQNPEHQLVATTVEEDLSFGLVNLGLEEAEIRRRMQQAAETFGLEALLERPTHMLSMGQKKSLSLADVMVLEPELLLLDEPTAYLSPGHGRALLQQLQRIHASGTTILVASHDMEFLNSWADWLFVIEGGRLVLEGTPADIFARRDQLEALNLGVPPSLDHSLIRR